MRRFATLVLLAGLIAVAPSVVRADGADSLGESYRATLVGGGVVSEGVGLVPGPDGPTSGVIAIAGIPEAAQLVRATLYWGVLAGTDPTVQLNGQSVLGSEIGRSPDPCWENLHTVDPSQDSRAYRADVASIVSGNGSYEISGVGGSGLAGEARGASLLVIYKDESADFQTTIILNDGSLTGGLPGSHRDAISHTFSGLPTISAVLGAKLHTGVGDGQPEFGDGHMTLGGTEMLPPDAMDGSDGASWDDDTMTVPVSLFGSTTPTIDNAIETSNDCLVWFYAALELRQDKSVGPPVSITITSPSGGAVLGTSTVMISGTSTGASSVRVTEGQQNLATSGVNGQGEWFAQVGLPDGGHTITATALDQANNPVAVASVQFSVSTGGPPTGPVTITSPANNSVLTSTSVSFAGTATGTSAVRMMENGDTLATVPVLGGGWSTQAITLPEGPHNVSAAPLDANGNQVGGFTFVQFGVDTSPPTIEMAEPGFPSPPGSNIQFGVGNADVRGSATDALMVARVVVSYREFGSQDPPKTVEANCGACRPSFCMFCGGSQTAEWYAQIEDIDGPAVYELTATAYDLTGHSATTDTRLIVEIFGNNGPGGLFGPDGPFEGRPPNCFGPLDGSPACFDLFGDDGPFADGGPFGIFGPDSPLCFGPMKDIFCN